jgi:hypothetical protein
MVSRESLLCKCFMLGVRCTLFYLAYRYHPRELRVAMPVTTRCMLVSPSLAVISPHYPPHQVTQHAKVPVIRPSTPHTWNIRNVLF